MAKTTGRDRIALLRTEQGVSRRELAENLGVHYQTVGYLERGENSPSLHLAMRIAEFFDVPVEVVFSLRPFPNQRPQGHSLLPPSPRVQPSGETIALQIIALHTLASHGPLSRRPGTQRPGIPHRPEPSHLAGSRRGLSLSPLLSRPDLVRTPAVSEADERHHRQDQRGFVGSETQGPGGAAGADAWKSACSHGSIARAVAVDYPRGRPK